MSEVRTRLWRDPEGLSSTAVQFRTDTRDVFVWMHTNIGWVPIGNAPRTEKEAQAFAEDLANSYRLEETSKAVATEFLGY
jgi:hypothetical protein